MKSLKIHISLDDTIDIFEKIYKENYYTIFKNDTLKFLKYLNRKFNINFYLFCFYQNNNFNLEKLNDKYKNEFKKNATWLKFGFHSLDGNSTIKDNNNIEIYEKTMKKLEEIVSKYALTNCIRIHKFEATKNFINNIQKTNYPLKILFTSEDPLRKNYYLNVKEENIIKLNNKYLDKNNNIIFLKSDVRLENISKPYKEVINLLEKKQSPVIIYTHEWKFSDENKIIKKKLLDICKIAKKYHYK